PGYLEAVEPKRPRSLDLSDAHLLDGTLYHFAGIGRRVDDERKGCIPEAIPHQRPEYALANAVNAHEKRTAAVVDDVHLHQQGRSPDEVAKPVQRPFRKPPGGR